MRWIHLTDLHCGMKNGSAQQTALKSLVAAITAAIGPERIDAIVISGDISYSGNASDFNRATIELIEPLRRLSQLRDSQLILAPGNHDIDCDKVDAIQWDAIGARRREGYFEESEAGRTLRRPRSRGFEEFWKFAEQNAAIAPNPLEEVTTKRVLELGGKTILLLITNTAFFSDRDPDVVEYEQIPAPTPSLRNLLSDTSACDHVLILGHHPIHWFRHDHIEPLKTLVVESNAIYLHGHEHDIQARIGPNGLLSLGFGAGYSNKQDPEKKDWYRNSFAICALTGCELHVAMTHWDPKYGRWAPCNSLPAEFAATSGLLKNGFRFELKARPSRGTLGGTRFESRQPEINRVLPIGEISMDVWAQLIVRCKLIEHRPLRTDDLVQLKNLPNTFEFRTKGNSNSHLVVCIQSPNSVLTRTHIENWNTKIDHDALESLTVVTLGTITDDGKTLYLRLAERKPLRVVLGERVAKKLATNLPNDMAVKLEDFSKQNLRIDIVLTEAEMFALVRDWDRTDWFQVINESGHVLVADEPLVHKLRESDEEISHANYCALPNGADRSPATESGSTFDRSEYLKKTHAHFNSAQYTALSAIGIRLPELPLEALYVHGSAETGTEAGRREALMRSIEANLDQLGLTGALRHDLEAQWKRAYGLEGSRTVSAARALYQTHGSVCVVGDPGSGKTCFVKSEVLAYCSPPEPERAWYENHVPVYVSLLDCVRRCRSSSPTRLIESAAELAGIRGLPIDTESLRRLHESGRVAFFFDGLDEVSSIEARARVAQDIRELIASGIRLGNRYVLTTRPGALRLVDIPKDLETIHMCGLTEQEQVLLARRILAARVLDEHSGISLDERALSSRDDSLVGEIVSDIQRSSGLRRLASNPLFLTLLVFIYANSGRPSARRHRVYAEAVRTLAAVRSRMAGQRLISESDLRIRLGMLALKMFRATDSAVIPRSKAKALLEELPPERSGLPENGGAETFLQDVSEATGLLIASRGPTVHHPELLSFMHQSFLEYFAAVGLMAEDYVSQLGVLAPQPRWREILQLLSGIVSEYSDVTPIIQGLLDAPSPVSRITLDSLLLAFDCALECEVPPERVQQILISTVDSLTAEGVFSDDSFIRDAVGQRLGRLSAATASPIVVRFLADGLLAESARTCAVYVEFLSFVANEVELSSELIQPYSAVCKRREAIVLAAVCNAVFRAPSLRVASAVDAMRAALSGSMPVRLAAAQSAAATPSLVVELWEELVKCMRESTNSAVAAVCAETLLTGSAGAGKLNESTERMIVDVLHRVDADLTAESYRSRRRPFDREILNERLGSPILHQRTLAIRTLAWLEDEEPFVMEKVRSVLKNSHSDHTEVVAALSVLARSRTLYRLMKIADADLIRSHLGADNRDVRISACRILGTIGASTQSSGSVTSDLLRYARRTRKTAEFGWAILSLAQVAQRDPEVARYVAAEATGCLGPRRRCPTGETLSLVRACQALDGSTGTELAARLRKTARDYRVTADTRTECVVAFVHVSEVNPELCEFIAGLFERPAAGAAIAPVRAVAALVGRCRKRVEDVRRVFVQLGRLRDIMLDRHSQYAARIVAELGRGVISEIREAIEALNDLLVAYREFSERRQLPIAGTSP